MDHYRAYGGPKPPPIDHQGIESGGEKASVVLYCYRGKWLKLRRVRTKEAIFTSAVSDAEWESVAGD